MNRYLMLKTFNISNNFTFCILTRPIVIRKFYLNLVYDDIHDYILIFIHSVNYLLKGKPMYSLIHSAVVYGVSGLCVEIETKISRGLPCYNIVGLPDTTIKESKERIRSAIESLDMNFPARRITLNLIPAETPKDGSHLDLPMAIGILCAFENINPQIYDDIAFFGELSLDGRLIASLGLLPMVISLMEKGIKKFIIPKSMENEIAYIPNIEYLCVSCIKDIYDLLHCNFKMEFNKAKLFSYSSENNDSNIDFIDVIGQNLAKRAFLVSACGFHSILLSGPPGSGKSMMVEAFRGLLPKLNEKEFLDVQKIYSVTSNNKDYTKWFNRPFRKPHQQVTPIALIGGGHKPKPGEVSLAHRGILFLDEITEFNKYALESLRQPLEMGEVMISRSRGQITMPAQIRLVATMNPCKCGYLYSDEKQCTCSDLQIRRYLSRLSGPILDRIDILVEVQRVKLKDDKIKSTTTAQMFEIVKKCVEIQNKRFSGKNIRFNSEITSSDIKKFCKLTNDAQNLLKHSCENLYFSQRVKYKLIKLARTIADIEDSENICSEHIAEAIQFRMSEKHLRGENI